MAVTGYVHSFESMGTLDGPGLRFVVFMQGCPLRCCYCHNPDSWPFSKTNPITPEAAAQKALRFSSFWGKDGGVTVSGGEPLAQSEFVAEFFQLLQKQGVHTTLDTSGAASTASAEKVLAHTSLVLADLKFATEQEYAQHCGGSLAQTKSFLQATAQRGVPVWLRHVVVPGLTDSEAYLEQLLQIAGEYTNIQKLELLGFRKICLPKYQAINIPFPLIDTPEMEEEQLAELQHFVNTRFAAMQ